MLLPAWVYVIRNEATGRSYVGISSNPKRRKKQHFWRLQAGKHPVEDMQTDFNKYGIASPSLFWNGWTNIKTATRSLSGR